MRVLCGIDELNILSPEFRFKSLSGLLDSFSVIQHSISTKLSLTDAVQFELFGYGANLLNPLVLIGSPAGHRFFQSSCEVKLHPLALAELLQDLDGTPASACGKTVAQTGRLI